MDNPNVYVPRYDGVNMDNMSLTAKNPITGRFMSTKTEADLEDPLHSFREIDEFSEEEGLYYEHPDDRYQRIHAEDETAGMSIWQSIASDYDEPGYDDPDYDEWRESSYQISRLGSEYQPDVPEHRRINVPEVESWSQEQYGDLEDFQETETYDEVSDDFDQKLEAWKKARFEAWDSKPETRQPPYKGRIKTWRKNRESIRLPVDGGDSPEYTSEDFFTEHQVDDLPQSNSSIELLDAAYKNGEYESPDNYALSDYALEDSYYKWDLWADQENGLHFSEEDDYLDNYPSDDETDYDDPQFHMLTKAEWDAVEEEQRLAEANMFASEEAFVRIPGGNAVGKKAQLAR